MDEMKLKLSTKFMRGIVAKLISKVVSSKFGYDVDILINEIEFRCEEGKTKLHIDLDTELTNDEFKKIVKTIGLD